MIAAVADQAVKLVIHAETREIHVFHPWNWNGRCTYPVQVFLRQCYIHIWHGVLEHCTMCGDISCFLTLEEVAPGPIRFWPWRAVVQALKDERAVESNWLIGNNTGGGCLTMIS